MGRPKTQPVELPATTIDQTIAQTAQQLLAQYNVTDAKIAELQKDYGQLTIAGADDKETYKTANNALAMIRSLRTGVEATRKQLKQPFWDAGVAIDNEAKRITAQLTPIEQHLSNQIKSIDDELERRRRAEETRRIALLNGSGFQLIGQTWQVGKVGSFFDRIMDMTNDEFVAFLDAGKAEKTRIDEEAAAAKAEADRLAAERSELEKLKAELAAREAALKAKEQSADDGSTTYGPEKGTPIGSGWETIAFKTKHNFVATDTPAENWIGRNGSDPQPTGVVNTAPQSRPTGIFPQPQPLNATTATISAKQQWFNDGWEACKTRIIKLFTEDTTPRKRAEWVEIFTNLKP